MWTRYCIAMKPNYKYIKTVANAFHITSALLENGDESKLFVTVNGQKFLVASLTRDAPKKNLDLNFTKGDQLIFHVVGKGEVNLEGYLLARDRNDTDEEDEDDDVAEESPLPDLINSLPLQQLKLDVSPEEARLNPPPRKHSRLSLETDGNDMELADGVAADPLATELDA